MISGSLVLYKNNSKQYTRAIRSFLNGCDGLLTVIDNSPVPLNNDLFGHNRVRYVHSGINLGFGVAHNKAVSLIKELPEFHLILNPDINFGEEVIPHLLGVMRNNPKIGALMPRVNYPDGSLQHLCKRLPTPVDLIFRRFIPVKSLRDYINNRYELHDLPQNSLSDVPVISGCFLIVRLDLFRILGGFDNRYFMYLEDVDLVRRIGAVARVVYDPRVNVIHEYAKGSYHNKKLLGYHMISAFRYFTKWGWLIDSYRKDRNSAVISCLQQRTK
jgi:GT2 family glycosyltransferase